MIQDEKSLTSSFDKSAKTYDNETDTLSHYIDNHVIEKHLEDFINKVKINKALDAGGGTGKWSIYLSQNGINVTLLDISKESLKIAKEKIKRNNLKIEIIESSAEKTPFSDNEFDFILLEGGVISYTPNPDVLLNEIYRILKPNGYCWIDFYNSIGWAMECPDYRYKYKYELIKDELIKMDDWDYPARIFSIERIKEKILKNSFQIVECFGNHILLNTIPLDILYSTNYKKEEAEKLKIFELNNSYNKECIGVSKNYKIIIQKLVTTQHQLI